MSAFTTRYKNKKFVKERIELDGHAYENCEFEDCMIVLEKGETEIKGASSTTAAGTPGPGVANRQGALALHRKPLKVLDFAAGDFGKTFNRREQRA
jgi:hypothetical protein